MILHYFYKQTIVNSWSSSIQTSGIIMQTATFQRKFTIFIKLLQEQSCNAQLFPSHIADLPVTNSSTTNCPHTGAITILAV
jgi:hypothetical protein